MFKRVFLICVFCLLYPLIVDILRLELFGKSWTETYLRSPVTVCQVEEGWLWSVDTTDTTAYLYNGQTEVFDGQIYFAQISPNGDYMRYFQPMLIDEAYGRTNDFRVLGGLPESKVLLDQEACVHAGEYFKCFSFPDRNIQLRLKVDRFIWTNGQEKSVEEIAALNCEDNTIN